MRAVQLGLILINIAVPNLLFAGWIPVLVTNNASSELGGYAIQLPLGPSFPFASCTESGSDIRIYDGTRTEEYVSYVESWDPTGRSGSIWFRAPYMPAHSTSNIWINFSGSGSFQSRLLPWGPYIPVGGNPIPFGGLSSATNFLAENIVYDPDTALWWLVISEPRSIDLAFSNDPTDPESWTWWGQIVPYGNGNGPCLIREGTTWYLFQDYSDQIAYRTATMITGPYSAPITVLKKGDPGTWESYRVTEPFVFKRGTNDWVLIYMGDSRTGGLPTEQVGYATANKITGPYSKYPGNPLIRFGPPGAVDAGTVADPWVLRDGPNYYIAYSISPTSASPWKTGLACTTDWTNVVKCGQLFVTGNGWDKGNAFRGAAFPLGTTYLLPYTSSDYKSGLAIARVIPNDPSQVFLWQDDFSGHSLDSTYWRQALGFSSQIAVTNGILTMNGASNPVQLNGPSVGQDYILEFKARHRAHGTLNRIMELGFGTPSGTCIRLDDDYTDTLNWEGRARISSQSITNLGVAADSNWHTFSVARTYGVAMWKVDDHPWTMISDTNVDSSSFLNLFMIAYGQGDIVDVDWARIRRFVHPEPTATLTPSLQILANDSGFGLKRDAFGFEIGGSNCKFAVQVSTNLANPVWSTVQTGLLTNGTYYFSQPTTSKSRSRFYRVIRLQ